MKTKLFAIGVIAILIIFTIPTTVATEEDDVYFEVYAQIRYFTGNFGWILWAYAHNLNKSNPVNISVRYDATYPLLHRYQTILWNASIDADRFFHRVIIPKFGLGTLRIDMVNMDNPSNNYTIAGYRIGLFIFLGPEIYGNKPQYRHR